MKPGSFGGTMQFSTMTISPNSSQSLFVAKLLKTPPTLSTNWINQTQGHIYGSTNGMVIDVQRNLFLTGSFVGGSLARFDSNGNLITVALPSYGRGPLGIDSAADLRVGLSNALMSLSRAAVGGLGQPCYTGSWCDVGVCASGTCVAAGGGGGGTGGSGGTGPNPAL